MRRHVIWIRPAGERDPRVRVKVIERQSRNRSAWFAIVSSEVFASMAEALTVFTGHDRAAVPGNVRIVVRRKSQTAGGFRRWFRE